MEHSFVAHIKPEKKLNRGDQYIIHLRLLKLVLALIWRTHIWLEKPIMYEVKETNLRVWENGLYHAKPIIIIGKQRTGIYQAQEFDVPMSQVMIFGRSWIMADHDNNIITCLLINVMKNFIFCRHSIHTLWLLFLGAEKRCWSVYAGEKHNKMRIWHRSLFEEDEQGVNRCPAARISEAANQLRRHGQEKGMKKEWQTLLLISMPPKQKKISQIPAAK